MAELKLGQEVISTAEIILQQNDYDFRTPHQKVQVITGAIWLIYKLAEKKNQVTIHLECAFS